MSQWIPLHLDFNVFTNSLFFQLKIEFCPSLALSFFLKWNLEHPGKEFTGHNNRSVVSTRCCWYWSHFKARGKISIWFDILIPPFFWGNTILKMATHFSKKNCDINERFKLIRPEKKIYNEFVWSLSLDTSSSLCGNEVFSPSLLSWVSHLKWFSFFKREVLCQWNYREQV